MMTINFGNEKDLEAIVEMTFNQNSLVEHSSNYFYKDKDKIRKDVLDAIERSEILVSKQSNVVTAVLLWFSNKKLQVCDCNIFVDLNTKNPKELMVSLIKHLRIQYDNTMKMNFFFPKQNHKYVEFLTEMNAVKKMNEYQLELSKGSERNLVNSETVRVLSKENYDTFAQLHDTIFPDIYINGKDVIDSIDKERIVYSIMDKEVLVAFGVLKKADKVVGTAEIIGVNKLYRRKGYGRIVLSHLIKEAFTTHNLNQLLLIVDSDNDGAIGLYLDLGFILKSLNYSYVIAD